MNWKKGNFRIWLFRALVAVSGILMVIAFILPWWIGSFDTGGAVNIYGWGLSHDLKSLASYVAEDVTPMWQVALAWLFVGISIGLALYSTWIKRWWGQLMLGVVGISLIAYVSVAINIVVKNRLAVFQIPLEGFTNIAQEANIFTELHTGYTLAYVAGAAFIVLALLRALITGKQQ